MATKSTSKTSGKPVKKTSVNSSPAKIESTPIKATTENKSQKTKDNRNVIAIVTATILVITVIILSRSLFIAATVNGEPVSRFFVVKELEKQGGVKTLESIITKKLIMQEMKKSTIVITQSDIDNETKKITANLVTQGTTLDQALAAQGMTKEQLNDELRIQLFIQKVIANNTKVTEKELTDFITANKAQFPEGTTEVQMKQQALQQLTQQAQQQQTQIFIKNLQDRAKIIRFVQY